MQRQTWACGKGMAPEAGPRHREWAVGLRVKPERAATRHRASAAASTLPLHCKYRVFLQATTVRPAACRGRVLSGRRCVHARRDGVSRERTHDKKRPKM
jgi:hypothetical protein